MDISQLGSRKIGVHVVFLSKINHIHGFERQSLILRQTPLWVSSIQTDTLTRKNIRVGRIQSSATQLVHCNGLLGKCSILFLLVKVISTVQGNIHIWTPSLYGFTWSLSRGAIHDTRSQDAPLVLLPGVLPKISRFVPKKLSLHWSVIASAKGFHRIFGYSLQYPFFFS